MKRVKDLKVGDHVYLSDRYGIEYERFFTVKEIKKRGTLATIKLSVLNGYDKIEAVAYGHVSSTTLSWFCRKSTFNDLPLTTNRESVEHMVKKNEWWDKELRVGKLVLELMDELKSTNI